MPYVIHYITSRHNALQPFPDLTNTDLYILDTLFNENKPLSFSVLLRLVQQNVNTIHERIFNDSLKRCYAKGYINRQAIGNNVLYNITLAGKLLVNQFNTRLESIVQEKITRYGKH